MKHYTHKLTTLLLAIVCMGGVQAAELTVANGNQKSAFLPIYGAEASYGFKNQFIYPSSMLSAISGKTIYGLTFYSSVDDRTSVPGKVTVKMAEVEQTTFGSTDYLTPTFTKVYEGTYDVVNYLLSFNFATPYEYGGGNLLVEIELSYNAGPRTESSFYGISDSHNGLYGSLMPDYKLRYLDNFLPKATFRYCGVESVLPWTEGFESVEEYAIPYCWDRTDENRVYVGEDSEYDKRAHSGTKYLRFSQTTATTPLTVVLPAFTKAIKELNIAFYYYTSVGASYGNPVVGYITTGGDFVGLDTLEQKNLHTAYDLNLSAAGDNAANIALRYVPGAGDYGWAIIDDVTISLIPECAKPTDVHETAVTASTATIGWTARSGETAWRLQTSTNGTDWSAEIAASTNPFTLTGLADNTRYYARVKAVCGVEDESEWSNADEFQTICATEIVPVMWTFEDQTVNAVPHCWDNSASTATSPYLGYDVRWSVYSYGGNKMIRLDNCNSHVTPGTALINTPSIELPGSPLMEMEFDYAHRANCGDMTVKISTDGGNTFSDLKSYSNTTGYSNYSYTDPGVFTTDIIDLSTYAGQTVILQFFANANEQEGAIFVDNVVIRMPASCATPKNITFSDITAHTASIAWQEMGTATEWRIQTSLNGTDWSEDIAATTNPFTLTGLNADTEYFIRVDAYCGVSSESEWSSVTTFRTKCAPQPMPLAEDFESALSSCWELAPQWALSDEEHVSGSKSIRFTAGTPADLRLPPMNLSEKAILTFWHKNPEVTFTVYANTVSDETNIGMFAVSDEWKKDTINLAAYTGQDVTLIIRGWYNDYKHIYIDDVAVTYAPVATPQNPVAEPANASAYLSWDAADEAVSYNLRWREQNAEPEANWTEENLDETNKTLSELTNDKTYEAQVQAVVSANRKSAWTEPVEFTPVACPIVTAVTLGEQSYNKVVVNWTATAASTWSLRYSTDGGSKWTTASEAITSKTYTLCELQNKGTYTIAVKPTCAADDAWVVANETFTTCQPITSLGWTEGFEDFRTGFLGLLCWDDLNAQKEGLYDYPQAYVYTHAYDLTYVHSGRKVLYFKSSEYKNVYAIFPEFSGSFDGLQISFWHMEEHVTASGPISIGYMTNIWDEASFVPIKVCKRKTREWQKDSVNISSVPSGARLAFRCGKVDLSGYIIGVDDISITALPACEAPDNLTVEPINTSAKITWTKGDGTQQLRYKAIAESEWTEVAAATSPYGLYNLINNTEYEVQVRSLCREDVFTDWSASVRFTLGTPTGVNHIGADTHAMKVAENGQVVIIRNGEKFTVLGQKIQ